MAFPIPAGLLESVDGKPLPQTQDTLENAMLNAQGRNGTALTMRGRIWQVGSGASTTSIPILDSNGLPVLMSASMQALYTNAKFEIIQAGTVELAVVTAVGASGTLTLDSALSSAPSAGTWFLLTPTEQTSLTGRNVTEVQFFNGLAITDTATHYSGAGGSGTPTSIANLGGRKIIHYSNSLNQQVTLTLYAYNAPGGFATNQAAVTLNASASGILTISNLSWLQEPLQQIKLSASCAVNPTSGSLSAYLEGVQQ